MSKLKEAFSNALGLSASDDKIRKHKKLRRQLNQRQGNIAKLDAILNDLRVEYMQYKHQIFFIRYRSMKRMIKSTVEQLREVLDDIQNQSTESEVEGQGSPKGFLENARRLADQEKYYSELSAKQVDEGLRNFPAQIQQLEEEFLMKRKLLEQLGTDYQNSKNLLYHKRYEAMKKMTKNTFSD